VSHAMTLSGATWSVDDLGSFVLADLPVCAASFDDRLYVFGVQPDGSISSLAYTVDGGTWTPRTSSPAGLQTVEPITTGVFRNRLYVFARDATTNAIRVSSSADLERWDTWVDVPHTGLAPQSPVAAIALGDTLHLFGIYQTGKRPAAEVVHNATVDGHTWTGWELVEGGARPDDELASEPLDVAAATFRDRVYIATRWVSTTGETTYSLAVNFSGDGDNWSGWRIPKVPETDDPYQPSATAGLAAVNNHLYVLTPRFVGVSSDNTPVWAY